MTRASMILHFPQYSFFSYVIKVLKWWVRISFARHKRIYREDWSWQSLFCERHIYKLSSYSDTIVPSDTIPGRFYFLEKLSSTWDSYILSKGIKKDSGKSFPGACSFLMLSETPITRPVFFRNTKRRKCLWETRKLQLAKYYTKCLHKSQYK